MNHPADRLLIRIHILGMSSAFFSAVFGPFLKLYIIQCEGSAINKLAGCQPLRVQVHVSLSKRWQCPCHAISGFTCAVANASVILTNMIKHIHYIVLPSVNKVKTYFTPAHLRKDSDSWCSSRQSETKVSASKVDHRWIIESSVDLYFKAIAIHIEIYWICRANPHIIKEWRKLSTALGVLLEEIHSWKGHLEIKRSKRSKQRQVLVVAPPLNVVVIQRPQPCAGQPTAVGIQWSNFSSQHQRFSFHFFSMSVLH